MPSFGQCSSAETTASWTSSSPRSKSPRKRTSAAVSLPASSRKTVERAASVAALLEPGGVLGFPPLDERPDFNLALSRPRFGQIQRPVEIGDVYDGESTDRLLGLDEGSVCGNRFAAVEFHGCRGPGRLQLSAALEEAPLRVLTPPLPHLLEHHPRLRLRHSLPIDLVDEQQHVFHRLIPPSQCECLSFPPTNDEAENRHPQFSSGLTSRIKRSRVSSSKGAGMSK